MPRSFKDKGYSVKSHGGGGTTPLGKCAFCGLTPSLLECPSGIQKQCSTLETEIYRLTSIGMSETEVCETLMIKTDFIAKTKAKGNIAAEKMVAGIPLNHNDDIYLRFTRKMAMQTAQLQIRLQHLITSRAKKGDISTKDAVAILERISKENWSKQSVLLIDDNRSRPMVEVIAPTVAMVIRGVLDGLGLSQEQLDKVPQLLEQSFSRFEIEAADDDDGEYVEVIE